MRGANSPIWRPSDNLTAPSEPKYNHTMYDFGEFRAEGPVMTFCANGTWLCVDLEQVDSIAQPERLCPVPLADPKHMGLIDRGDSLIPVMNLAPDSTRREDPSEPLVAVLQVRGESVGLLIDRAGRVEERYWSEDATTPVAPPAALEDLAPRRLLTAERPLWLIDADRLWRETDDTEPPEARPGTTPTSITFPGSNTFKD